LNRDGLNDRYAAGTSADLHGFRANLAGNRPVDRLVFNRPARHGGADPTGEGVEQIWFGRSGGLGQSFGREGVARDFRCFLLERPAVRIDRLLGDAGGTRGRRFVAAWAVTLMS
jgi:hypothetical protein